MDVVKVPYYNLIRYIVIIAGQSICQPKMLNSFIQFIALLVIISFLVAQIAAMVERIGDLDLILECIPPICFTAAGVTIYMNNILQLKQINILFHEIKNDWDTLTSKQENDILHEYGKKYKNYATLFIVALYGNLFTCLLAHNIPLTITVLKKSNETKPIFFPVEYGIDSEKYYYLILFFSEISCIICVSMMVNGEAIFFLFLKHACGMFEIIGHKLTTAINENHDEFRVRQKVQHEIKLCVSMHRKVLLFVNDTQDAFSAAYLLVLGFVVIDLSITGVQCVMYINNTKEAIRFGTYTLAQVMHIFFLTLPTQELFDKSLRISSCIYDSTWYLLSSETKRMLLMIMRRGYKPTPFVVGKLFALSLQFFTKILQTAMSYFTVLMSVREMNEEFSSDAL